MKRTIPLVVSCLSVLLLSGLWSYELKALEENSCTSNIPTDTLFFRVNDCAATASICIDSLPLAAALRFSILDNGLPYATTLNGCNIDTLSAYTYTTLFNQGNAGPYELTAWSVDDTIFTGIFNTIPDLVDSMNRWDPMGDWQLDENTKLISGGVAGTTYSDMTVQVIAINMPSIIGYSLGTEAKGTELHFGAGIHNVSIFDSLNNTFRKAVIIVSCARKRTFENQLLPGETQIHCLDFSNLFSTPKVVGFCDFLKQENIDYQILNGDSCVAITGVSVGTDTACIIACDRFNFCDTTLLISSTYDVPRFREIAINLEAGTKQSYCLDTSVIASPIQTFFNNCPLANNNAAIVNLDPLAYCARIEGISSGIDTSCLIFCNQIGICDTTILYINVHPSPKTDTLSLSLTNGEKLEICPETIELAGNVTGIANFCENNSSETVIFTINNVDLCFEIGAQSIGVDTICTLICDNYLICDTTYYFISVVSPAPSLTANPDRDTVSINTPLTINILGNDDIPNGIITNLELYSPNGNPINGMVTINPDGTLTYMPNQDFCGDLDSLQYIGCNSAGCDTTSVYLFITCESTTTVPMRFNNGISPNGDGINDRFVIEGIAQYPNNKLTIVNRWGIRVYEMQGYKNAWDGTWNRKPLPDGAYYYILKDGKGKEYSGLLYIRR